jgi:hypothetical protein
MNELITVRGGARDDSSDYIVSQSKSQLQTLRASGSNHTKLWQSVLSCLHCFKMIMMIMTRNPPVGKWGRGGFEAAELRPGWLHA